MGIIVEMLAMLVVIALVRARLRARYEKYGECFIQGKGRKGRYGCLSV